MKNIGENGVEGNRREKEKKKRAEEGREKQVKKWNKGRKRKGT